MQTKPAPLCRVDIYSHFFTVTKARGPIPGILFRLAHKYTKFEFVKVAGKNRREAGSVFGLVTSDDFEHRFSIGQLSEFVNALREAYISPDMFEWVVNELYTPDKIDVESRPEYVLRPDQEKAQQFILSDDVHGDKHTRFISMPPGSGKSQPYDALIKVPRGWKRMGDIRRGDTITAYDGTETVVEGIYPQGKLEVISFSFEDGRKAESSLDHLWKVRTDKDDWKILNTSEIIQLLDKGINCYLPLRSNESSENEGYLPIDPPLLIAMVKQIVAGSAPERAREWLKKVGLFDDETVIPSSMMASSASVRKQLLRQLIGKNPVVTFDDEIVCFYKDESVLKGMQKLVWSLGGVAIIGQESITIKHLRANTQERRKAKKVQLTGYERVGLKECQCITIRHPEHLYLTNDHIVTHNTVVSLVTTAHPEARERVMITMLSKYMKKWPDDVAGITNTPKKRIMTIEGSKELKTLIAMAKDGDELPNYIVFSMDTLINFYKAYLENRKLAIEEYGCHPQDLPRLLKAGQLIIDEAHEHFHKVFHVMTFNHIPKIVGLSGTLVSQDPFLQNIHEIVFPKSQRFDDIKVVKYIKSFSFGYSFMDFRGARIQTTERGDSKYSHSAFEVSIMRNRTVLANYLKLIEWIVEWGYIKDKMEGDRFAVFARRRDMCTIITEHLAKKYPHLTVKRYVEGDPYKENMLDADIRVTTIQSGGTAHDIPNLRGMLLTIAMRTITGNLQGIGRLRNLKDRDVKFFTMHSYDIPKHIAYHKERMGMVDDRTLFYKEFRAPFDI